MVTMSRSRKSWRLASSSEADGVGERLGLFEDLGRKLMRDVMLADDDFDVDAEVVRMAQDFDDAADGVVAVFGKFEDFDVDDHAVEIFGTLDVERFDADAVPVGAWRAEFPCLRECRSTDGCVRRGGRRKSRACGRGIRRRR